MKQRTAVTKAKYPFLKSYLLLLDKCRYGISKIERLSEQHLTKVDKFLSNQYPRPYNILKLQESSEEFVELRHLMSVVLAHLNAK